MEEFYSIANRYFDMCKRGHEICLGDDIEAVEYAYWKKRDDGKLFLIERIIPPTTSGLSTCMKIYKCYDRLHPIYSPNGPAPNWHTGECDCLEYLVELFYPEALSK